MEHVKAMVAFGPRPAGSPALLKNRDYIRDELKKLGLPANEQNWNEPGKNKTIRMHNIWTEIPGSDPKNGPIFLFCAHYDTKKCEDHPDPKNNFEFVGAIDGAGGSSVLLEFAKHVKDRKNVPNIWILWVDGEEAIPWVWPKDNSQALHGSKHFVKTMSKDKERFPRGLKARLKAFVLIDLVGSKKFKVDKDLNSSPVLNKIYEDAAKKMGEESRMYATESNMTDDHIPFKDMGINVIDLIDFHNRTPSSPKVEPYEQWWHTDKDTVEAMDPLALQFVGNLLWQSLPLLEEQYLGIEPK